MHYTWCECSSSERAERGAQGAAAGIFLAVGTVWKVAVAAAVMPAIDVYD